MMVMYARPYLILKFEDVTTLAYELIEPHQLLSEI